ncbi:MAG TPA: GxxExxY protein [Verrucomicrobiae bacterium]|nr:GxxExxY protein [Verrucomicrobiae bacterium]
MVIGSAFEVLNTLGAGLLEKVYERALTLEFRDLQPESEVHFRVLYKKPTRRRLHC